MSEPIEFPINLMAFCRLAVKRLGYRDTERVLDVLDENFPMPQDRALDCNFDPGLAWVILRGEQGGSNLDIAIALIAIVIVALLAFICALSGPIPTG